MTVNGVDISIYHARQSNVTPGKRSLSNASEWGDGAPAPILISPEFGLKSYKIVLVVYGDTREELWERISGVLSLFTRYAEVKLDGFEHTFMLSLTSVQHDERTANKKRWQTLTLEVVGYEYGSTIQKEVSMNACYADAGKDFVAVTKEVDLLEEGVMAICNTVDITAQTDISPGHSGVEEMNAFIRISGLCVNKYRKDAGDIVMDCGKAAYVAIDGRTGTATGIIPGGNEVLESKGIFKVSIPSLPYVYEGVKKVKVTIEFNKLSEHPSTPIYIKVTFRYNPLFL